MLDLALEDLFPAQILDGFHAVDDVARHRNAPVLLAQQPLEEPLHALHQHDVEEERHHQHHEPAVRRAPHLVVDQREADHDHHHVYPQHVEALEPLLYQLHVHRHHVVDVRAVLALRFIIDIVAGIVGVAVGIVLVVAGIVLSVVGIAVVIVIVIIVIVIVIVIVLVVIVIGPVVIVIGLVKR